MTSSTGFMFPLWSPDSNQSIYWKGSMNVSDNWKRTSPKSAINMRAASGKKGNTAAQGLVERVYQECDAPWRGFGVITGGGLRLRERFARFDAVTRFGEHLKEPLPIVQSDCPAAEVLSGKMRPSSCTMFGTRCTPDRPLGAPMVSSEGACAAYFRYQGATR